MSWDESSYSRRYSCKCGRGYIEETGVRRDDDWNRTEFKCSNKRIVCTECVSKYYIDDKYLVPCEYHIPKRPTEIIYYKVSNGLAHRDQLAASQFTKSQLVRLLQCLDKYDGYGGYEYHRNADLARFIKVTGYQKISDIEILLNLVIARYDSYGFDENIINKVNKANLMAESIYLCEFDDIIKKCYQYK